VVVVRVEIHPELSFLIMDFRVVPVVVQQLKRGQLLVMVQQEHQLLQRYVLVQVQDGKHSVIQAEAEQAEQVVAVQVPQHPGRQQEAERLSLQVMFSVLVEKELERQTLEAVEVSTQPEELELF
jgi:hypothetical protein